MKPSGLTLIEVMIIIAIIGILAAIAIPAFQEHECKNGNKEVCKRIETRKTQQNEAVSDGSWRGQDICLHGVRYYQPYDSKAPTVVELGPDGKPLVCP